MDLTKQFFVRRMKNLAIWRFMIIAALLATCGSSGSVPAEGKLLLMYELPDILRENSGMIEYDELLWFVNDGGNESVLYGFDPVSGTIVRQVQVAGTENIDWEELTQDNEHLYIGDFGNNAGDRKDLRILILDKDEMASSNEISPSGTISFSYPDQTDFTPTTQQTTFDCEAFLVLGDSILLFTKDWANEETRVYSLPASSGDYQATYRERFDSAGLVTGSAYLPAEEKLVLVGYANYQPFLWIINGFTMKDIRFRNPVRIDFPSSFAVQTEAVVLSGQQILVSSEAALFPPQLHSVEY